MEWVTAFFAEESLVEIKERRASTEWDIRSGVRTAVGRWRTEGSPEQLPLSFSRDAPRDRSLRPPSILFVPPITPFILFRRFHQLFSFDVLKRYRTTRRCRIGVFVRGTFSTTNFSSGKVVGDRYRDELSPSGETSPSALTVSR